MPETIIRCAWCGTNPIYQAYHDHEWGKPVMDDKTLFEFLVLESAQAGLSWFTILQRREGYRALFADFDVQQVAAFSEQDIDRIVQDARIIRHRGKIAATISNAAIFMDIQNEFGSFYTYLYRFMPEQKPLCNHIINQQDAPVTSPESDNIAKDLKKRGVKFFGSTICYAYMQAVGMVNDHIHNCSFRSST